MFRTAWSAVAAPIGRLRGSFERQVSKFIPPGIDADTESRARLTVGFALLFGTVAAVYAVLSFVVGKLGISTVAVAAAVLMFSAPVAMRRRKSVTLGVHIEVFGGWVAVSAIAAISGGMYAPALSWLALVPTGALFLAGRRAGTIWFCMSMLSAALLLAFELAGQLPTEAPGDTLTVRHFVALLALVVMLGMVMRLYDSNKTRMLEEIREANLELARSRDAAHALVTQLAAAQARIIEEAKQQRKLELELRQSQKLEAVGRLASGVAHELNTPLQFVADSVAFVDDSAKDLTKLLSQYQEVLASQRIVEDVEHARDSLSELEEAIDLSYLLENVPGALTRAREGLARMSGIVTAMRDFAYADRAEVSPLDINKALENTLTIARSEYRALADVETVFGELPPVTCRAGEINQVFLNIIVNAAHAIGERVEGTQERGRITIRTESSGGRVVVSITDTGAGIPDEVRGRIFDPFFTTKQVGKGTGQGLAIARSIVVDKHGGTLEFETEVGRGTTFSLALPIEPLRRAA